MDYGFASFIYIHMVIRIIFLITFFVVIYTIIRRVRRFNKNMFGTERIPLNEAMEGFREGLDDTDLSPKSVSSMTGLFLPRIIKDFPEFNYNEMKEAAKNVIFSYLQAIDERRSSILCDGTSDLKRSLADRITRNSGNYHIEHFKEVKLHRMEISKYEKSAGVCTITFQAALQCYHYITEEENEACVVKGSKDKLEQSKYEVDLIYIQDRDMVEGNLDEGAGLTCPKCGAPIKTLGVKRCEYCDTPVIEFNIKVWEFSRCEQVD